MIHPDNFRYTEKSLWTWSSATPADMEDIINMVIREYELDAKNLWPIDPVEASRNLMHAIVNQMYGPKGEFVSVARRKSDNKLLAFTWVVREQRMVFSREEMATARFASVDLNLPVRQRVALIFQMFRLWEKWADICEIKMIASSCIRLDWEPLMFLHDAAGYHVRGTLAWKRLSIKTIKLDDPIFSLDTITSRTGTYDPSKYTDVNKEHSVSSKEFRYQ